MIGIVDCNSFYCSCERVFRPELDGRPVVVLSNNDGCVIARTDEAKDLGVNMTGPYFMVKDLIEEHGVTVFSSNYNLYGDMSRRVMEVLKSVVGEGNVEVYSIDEAFIDLAGFAITDLDKIAVRIKTEIEGHTGIKVSVGVAPTKTLSKLANKIAKKNKDLTGCVHVLATEEKISAALQKTPVQNIWGIGGQYASKLTGLGIDTAWRLRQMPEEWVRKHLGGVVGVRLLKELQGKPVIVMNQPLETKKMIATTRMFGSTVNNLADIKEAVATYTTRAAEKLRRQHSAAAIITVFVVQKEKAVAPHFRHGPTLSAYTVLPYPTAVTPDLIKPAVQLAARLFEEGKEYKKAGVILSGLVPDNAIQANLFEPTKSIGRFLMEMVDSINFGMRDEVVKFASSGTKRNWKMQRQFHSPRYTTRWNELYQVK